MPTPAQAMSANAPAHDDLYATLLDDICDLPGVASRRDNVLHRHPMLVDAYYDGSDAPPCAWKHTLYVADTDKSKYLHAAITTLVRKFMSGTILGNWNVDPFGVQVRITYPAPDEEKKSKPKRKADIIDLCEAAEAADAPEPADDGAIPEAKDERKQYRHWGFTYPGEGPAPDALFKDAFTVLVAQRETASTGFHHWQGCITFKAQRRFNEVRTQIHAAFLDMGIARPPIWLCNFTEGKDAVPPRDKEGLAKYRNYCRKSQDPKGGVVHTESRIVVGLDPAKVSRQGKRMDLCAFRDLVKAKGGKLDVMDADLGESELQVMAKHPRFADELCMRYLYGKPKALKEVFCFWGGTGTGKSTRAFKLARALYQEHEIWLKPPSKTWWDGYNPSVHKCVIVDEFAKGGTDSAVHANMLQVTDKTTPVVQCERKGSYMVIDPERVIFTSIMHPDAWIQSWNHQDNGEQYTRRMTAVFECKQAYRRPEDNALAEDSAVALEAIMEDMPL